MQKPQDALVVNGWYLNLPVPGILAEGLFETLEGMGKSSGNVEMVDAGSNHVYNFTDQLTRYDEMTLTRTYQSNATDRAMEALVSTMIETGLKLPATAVKMHHGQEVFTIIFEGFRFTAVKMPTLDVVGSDKFTVSYTAMCDGWEIVPVGR